MNYSAILLLAGQSTRFNADLNTEYTNYSNKVYEKVLDKSLFEYSLDVFENDDCCDKIIIVYNKNDEEILFNSIKSEKVIYALGGSERYKSVLNGLDYVKTEYVLVHDGARPLITKEMVNKVLDALKSSDCVSIGLPVTDTIKKVNNDGYITTVDRDSLYSVQTPQGAKTELLKYALNKCNDEDKITDDLMAIEKYTSIVPKIVLGNKTNIKVTTKLDLKLVELYLKLGE